MLEFCSIARLNEKKCDKGITHTKPLRILRWSFSLHTQLFALFSHCLHSLFFSLSLSVSMPPFLPNVAQYLLQKSKGKQKIYFAIQCKCNAMRSNERNSFNICKRFFFSLKQKRAKEESIFKCLSSSFEWCSYIGIVYKSKDRSVIFHVRTYTFVSMDVYGWCGISYLILPSTHMHTYTHSHTYSHKYWIVQVKWHCGISDKAQLQSFSCSFCLVFHHIFLKCHRNLLATSINWWRLLPCKPIKFNSVVSSTSK